MAWTSAIDTVIINQASYPINASYTLEVRNGYQNKIGGPWTEIKIMADGWETNIVDGNPTIKTARFRIVLPEDDFTYLDEFDHDNPVQEKAECRFKCTVITTVGTETEYLFRGTIKSKQVKDMTLIVNAVCPLNRMQEKAAPIDMEADIEGPYADSQLRRVPGTIYDDAGTAYTFEIDPTWNCPGPSCQDWAEDYYGLNRAWVPSVVEIEIFTGTWDPVLPSEYFVDTALGLIRFSSDQFGNTFRIKEVSVYIEGSLEVADVLEEVFTTGGDCPTVGCNFAQSRLNTSLSGNFTLVNDSVAVLGVGTAFLSELEVGDRFAHNATGDTKAIVASIADNFNLTLKYPYRGVTAGPLPGFKSSLKEAGISLSKIKWESCEGSAADLYRKLQEYYADSKGYKIWFDHLEDKIIGKQVAILSAGDPDIITLGPKLGLSTSYTTQDFGTAVKTTGLAGAPINLTTLPTTVVTEIATPFDPLWQVGPSTGGAPQTWGNLTFQAAISAVNDANTGAGWAMFHDYPDFPSRDIGFTIYNPFLKFDLAAVYDLSRIILYRMNSRPSRANETMGVSIYGSVDDITYTPLSPETIGYEMSYDEVKEYDLEEIASVRYIKIHCRPGYFVDSGKELTMGFREIQIFGTETICQTVCIQDEVAPGLRQSATGTITFTAGGPPFLVDGFGTNFGGVGEPQLGDAIALDSDPTQWAIIETINAPFGVGCVELRHQYGGVLPSGPGVFSFTDMLSGYEEGVGGHFIGGSTADADFIIDYYPDLMTKLSVEGHIVIFDDSDLIFTDMQALDRAYLVLNEVIRLYRQIGYSGLFDPRVKIFDTVTVTDAYRETGTETLRFLVQAIKMTSKTVLITGTEYGAGVLN